MEKLYINDKEQLLFLIRVPFIFTFEKVGDMSQLTVFGLPVYARLGKHVGLFGSALWSITWVKGKKEE